MRLLNNKHGTSWRMILFSSKKKKKKNDIVVLDKDKL